MPTETIEKEPVSPAEGANEPTISMAEKGFAVAPKTEAPAGNAGLKLEMPVIEQTKPETPNEPLKDESSMEYKKALDEIALSTKERSNTFAEIEKSIKEELSKIVSNIEILNKEKVKLEEDLKTNQENRAKLGEELDESINELTELRHSIGNPAAMPEPVKPEAAPSPAAEPLNNPSVPGKSDFDKFINER